MPSEDWLDDSTAQDYINSSCQKWIGQGKAGRPFTVFSFVEALVCDVTNFLKCFGSYLEIHHLNASKLDQVIGDFLVITAIQKKDSAAWDWVVRQCQDMVTRLGNGGSVALPEVLSAAQEEVCRLVEDDILPISPEALIEYGVSKALAENGVSGVVENLELLSRQYKKLQVRWLVFRGMVYLTSHGSCITQGVLTLNPMPRVYLALTYGTDGSRQRSQSVIASLTILKPLSGYSSFDSNLSYSVIRPLRSFIATAFTNKISQIVQNPAGRGQMLQVLLTVFSRLRTDFFRDIATALVTLEESFRNLADPIGDIEVAAKNLSNVYLASTGLDCHDRDVFTHLVTLYLAVKTKADDRVAEICAQLCEAGIPDPRTQLFTPGVQVLDRALDEAR